MENAIPYAPGRGVRLFQLSNTQNLYVGEYRFLVLCEYTSPERNFSQKTSSQGSFNAEKHGECDFELLGVVRLTQEKWLSHFGYVFKIGFCGKNPKFFGQKLTERPHRQSKSKEKYREKRYKACIVCIEADLVPKTMENIEFSTILAEIAPNLLEFRQIWVIFGGFGVKSSAGCQIQVIPMILGNSNGNRIQGVQAWFLAELSEIVCKMQVFHQFLVFEDHSNDQGDFKNTVQSGDFTP